jgi:hypothetical protein
MAGWVKGPVGDHFPSQTDEDTLLEDWSLSGQWLYGLRIPGERDN